MFWEQLSVKSLLHLNHLEVSVDFNGIKFLPWIPQLMYKVFTSMAQAAVLWLGDRTSDHVRKLSSAGQATRHELFLPIELFVTRAACLPLKYAVAIFLQEKALAPVLQIMNGWQWLAWKLSLASRGSTSVVCSLSPRTFRNISASQSLQMQLILLHLWKVRREGGGISINKWTGLLSVRVSH